MAVNSSLRVSTLTTSSEVHAHDYQQLMICLQGDMHFELSSGSSHVVQGCVGLFPLGSEHRYAVQGRACRALVMDFVSDDPLIKALEAACETSISERLMVEPKILAPMSSISKLIGCYESLGRFDQLHLMAVRQQLSASLLTELLLCDLPQERHELRASRVDPAQLQAWVDARLSGPIAVEDIAAAFHTSTSHLYVLVKRSLGCSPAAFVAQRRMHKALTLLRETRQSIGSIANAVGFSDTAAFGKAFRRAYLQSPTMYRVQ